MRDPNSVSAQIIRAGRKLQLLDQCAKAIETLIRNQFMSDADYEATRQNIEDRESAAIAQVRELFR